MSKLINRPLWVKTKDGLPSQFSIGGRQIQIDSIADHWKEIGRWWEGDEEREFFRVETAGGGYILSLNIPTQRWFLYKILD